MRSVVVGATNLYAVAARELGDATQWIRIAQLNQLLDSEISVITTLLIPQNNKNSGGGIGSQ